MAFIGVNTALVPIYQTLSGDATLLQNGYLNGSGKVRISPMRPQNAVNPCLVMRARAVSNPGGENETFKFDWLLELVLYLDDFVSEQPDGVRAEAIDKRVFELLDRKVFTNGAVSIYTTIANNFGTYFKDPAVLHESFWVTRYDLMAK